MRATSITSERWRALRNFAAALSQSVTIEIGGHPCRVLSLEALIKAKEDSGRRTIFSPRWTCASDPWKDRSPQASREHATIRFRHEKGLHTIETELWLPRPIAQVFPFFADAMKLAAITPALLRFTILTPPPIVMREGRGSTTGSASAASPPYAGRARSPRGGRRTGSWMSSAEAPIASGFTSTRSRSATGALS